jgi:ubiquitin carboxyl-terminal hydrolase 25/28
LQDLLRFDPQAIHADNILLVDPPQYDGASKTHGPPLVLDKGSCKHEYYTHLDRSSIPQIDEASQQDTHWKVAATCRKCRVYLSLSLNYPELGCKSPCPNRAFPLHHFRHEASYLSEDIYHFQCSNPDCQATILITFANPVLSKNEILLLTDEPALKSRYEAVLEATPDRAGVRLASPLDVFSRLKRYVSDSLIEDNARRTFPARNKRFAEAFGTDCDSVLYCLGFESGEDDNGEEIWKLPSPKPAHDPDPLRLQLERLMIEVQFLIDDYCASHAAPNPSRPNYRNAKVDLERTLSAQGCMSHV